MHVADEIEKLVKLRDRGVLSEEEFQELKAETLGMEMPSALVKNDIDNNTIKETESVVTAEPVTTGPPDSPIFLEDSQETKAESSGMEKPAALVKNDKNNSNIQEIKKVSVTIVTDEPLEKISLFKNNWVKAVSVLLAATACVSLGIWIARPNNESVAKTASKNEAEPVQEQDVALAEYAKLDAKLDKLQAAFNNKQNSVTTENLNTNTISENKDNANPATEPMNKTQVIQASTVTEQEVPPATDVTSPTTAEVVSQQSPTKDLIQYPSDATPFVLQMLESARDTEKLLAAKSSLDALVKPAKGDRKAARKLNDSAIALMGEKKYAEAIPILEDAHKTDPADIEIMNNLAYAYIEKGIVENNFTKAKESLVDTLHLKPERAQAWANLGHTFALEGNETAASNCYINFFRFAENKEKALSRLQSGINETNPVLGKALTNAYSYVKTSIEPTNNSEDAVGK